MAPGTCLAPAMPASRQPHIRTGRDFIFLEVWRGTGDVPSCHQHLRDAPCSLRWAPGGGSPVGLAAGGMSLLRRACELRRAEAARRGRASERQVGSSARKRAELSC